MHNCGVLGVLLARVSAQDGHTQSVGDQFGAHVVSDRPADDPAGERVEHGGAVHLALLGGVLGDVGDPEAVRLGHREVAFDQVRAGCGSRVADRTAAVSPPVEALNACLTHQPGDPFEVDLIAQFHRQLGVHARRTVRPAGLLVDLPDDLEQQLVVLLAG